MTYLQALIFGMLQGITELFPVSSLGHSVIFPHLLGWRVNQNDPFFLIFLVATHTATALVLFGFFFKDWLRIFKGMGASLKNRAIEAGGAYGKLGWLLVVATIPAGVLGLLFEESLKHLFASPKIVAGVLILNGIMLLGADILRKRTQVNEAHDERGSDERISKLSWARSIKVGLLQSIALFPGFSRTGATITGGLLVGLSYEDAARFSFLLATPIIGAASLLKLPELLAVQSQEITLGPILVGSLAAGFFAYLSVRFLLKYFETKKLWPFGLYCLLLGIITSLLFLLS